ncbi:MAG TPA: oligosaccharide flippase family protein, partial [Burkholderiales bacterium]|nr:oligosaccharide flippase family protein [Burkholderiales bacterium]
MQGTASVRHNIIANFAARAWSALMTLAFLPLYIRFLGIEAYGLVGVYVSLVALFAILDMGLSTTLTRELARLSSAPDGGREARDLTRTFELIYWGVGILIGGGVAALAPVIARHWLNVEGLPIETVEQSAMIMGLAMAMQWPISLYSGGLMGLQRQVLMNIVRAGASTLQGAGAVLVLWLISPTILAFFSWQIAVSALQAAVIAACLWKSLPAADGSASFRGKLLAGNWRFAGGMTAIAVLVAVLTQSDKFILSKMLSLEMFGYYSLAAAIASALSYISNPIFSALFPRLSQVVGRGNEAEVALIYHKGCQLMTATVVPVGTIVVLFSEELLTLWMRDATTVGNIHLLVSLLVTGTVLNSLMILPYALQLAYGWTRLVLVVNAVSVVLFVPLLILLADAYGGRGAALAWIALNAAYLVVVIPLMHRRLIRHSMGQWYLGDIGLPGGLCLGIGALTYLV